MLIVLLLVSVCLYVTVEASSVTVLDASNFAGETAGKDWLIEFYAPWCGFCKKLAPVWEQVGDHFASEGSVKVGKVDCDTAANKDICGLFDVTGFPTIYFVAKDGRRAKHNGARDVASFKKLAADALAGKMTLTAGRKLEEPTAETYVTDLTDDNFDTLTSNSHWMLEFYAPWCGFCKQLKPTWALLGQKLAEEESGQEEKVNVGKIDCTAEPDVCEQHGVRGFPTIMYKGKSGYLYKHEGDRTLEALQEFIRTHTSGKYQQITRLRPPTGVKEIDRFINMLRKDFDELWALKKGILALVGTLGFLAGIMTCCFAQCLFSSKKSAGGAQKRKKE